MKKIFTVKDIKVGTFFPPNFATHQTELTRALSEIVNQDPPQHQFAKYPQDFELYEIGEFNESLGTITNKDKIFVMNLPELKVVQND